MPDPDGFAAIPPFTGDSTLRFFGGGAKALSLTLFMRSIMPPMPAPLGGMGSAGSRPSMGSSGEANENATEDGDAIGVAAELAAEGALDSPFCAGLERPEDPDSSLAYDVCREEVGAGDGRRGVAWVRAARRGSKSAAGVQESPLPWLGLSANSDWPWKMSV
jgi:hypothetical protein